MVTGGIYMREAPARIEATPDVQSTYSHELRTLGMYRSLHDMQQP